MRFLFVYSPTDFEEALPDELSGGNAAGSAPYTLTLKPGATPTLVAITDNDDLFEEEDNEEQFLTNDVDIDGIVFPAGTSIVTAYDLINDTTGHQVTSLHFNMAGRLTGPVDGVISTIPLEPGQTYTFDRAQTSASNPTPFQEFVTCFVSGTRILTQRGLQPVECLVPGDELKTRDRGFQPIRKVVHRHVRAVELQASLDLVPVRIARGALGQGLPSRALMVSPQHRFLANSLIVKRMFGEDEVLVAAKKLTTLPGIEIATETQDVDYYHFLLDRHEIIFAEGAPTESLYFGPMALSAVSPEALKEIYTLFPELKKSGLVPKSARSIPSPRQQKRLIERHDRNKKALLHLRTS